MSKFFLVISFSWCCLGSGFITKNHPLMNRIQLYELLRHTFGSKSENILRKNILKNSTVFYGPCDIYGQVYKEVDGKIDVTDPKAECINGLSENKIDVNAKPSSLRTSWLLKTCIELVENKDTLEYFVKKYPDPSKAFYPLNEFDIKEKNLEKKIVKLCVSKGWQRL